MNLPLRSQNLLKASESEYSFIYSAVYSVVSAESERVSFADLSEKGARFCPDRFDQLWFHHSRKVNWLFNWDCLDFQDEKKD